MEMARARIFGWSDSGPSAAAWLGNLEASGHAAVVAAVARVVIGGWLGLRLMLSYGRVLLRLRAPRWAVTG